MKQYAPLNVATKWLLQLVLIALFFSAAAAHAQDSRVKTWATAELLGSMRWAKSQAKDGKERLDFSAAEIVCYKRLNKQIDSGEITREAALIISERARKKGLYKGEQLTIERAHELRRLIITGKFLESVSD